ncbi:MAG TPA: hypothetical protein VFB39_00750 [Solirubrobacteraceae bacterium]|nr:hypothetical protein [Solirubrobacteraceae bacterium]
MNAPGVENGKRGTLCAEMSVREPSGSWNVTAMPRTSGTLSGCDGLPAPFEKRTVASTV